MLPLFLCIGAQKAGTSWFNNMLRSHPGIWMPPVKELHYFNHLYVARDRKWTTEHITRSVARELDRHIKQIGKPEFSFVRYLADMGSRDLFTEDWYRRAFDRPDADGRLLGEITPAYSTIPDAGIRYVRSLLGAVKIIYIIREPISRALSQLRMNVQRKGGATSEDWWLKAADEVEAANRGDYQTYLPRWKGHFASEDILFLPYGLIAKNPAGFMREVEIFLGLKPHAYPALQKRIHASKKIDIPEWIVRRFEERLEVQRAFILSEFGSDFARLT